jgi:hypothetical protein
MKNPLQVRVVAVISTACVLLLTNAAKADDYVALQPGNSQFPTVQNIRFSGVSAGFEFQVSNDGQYIFETGGGVSSIDIKQTTAKNGPALYYFGAEAFSQMIGWSPDNTQLAMTFQSDTCTYPELESQVTLFNAATGTHSGFCIPVYPDELHPTSWSPFSNNILYMQDKWLIDTTTHAITDVKFPRVEPSDFPKYITTAQWTGLGHVLWDNTTQQPFGIVKYHDYKPGRAFYVCQPAFSLYDPDPTMCNQFYQIPDPSPIAYVGPDWKLSTLGHFLLWMSNEIPQVILSQTPTIDTTQQPIPTASPSPNPLFSPTPFPSVTPVSLSNYATALPTSTIVPFSRDQLDTVLYLTEIPSGVTKELYRWTGLQRGGQYSVGDFDWSVDGRTIALSVEGTHRGTLLLSLQWP